MKSEPMLKGSCLCGSVKYEAQGPLTAIARSLEDKRRPTEVDPTELTIEILKGIRDETRKTNERVEVLGDEVQALRGEMKESLRELGTELVDRIERVELRQTETELRLATELIGVAGAVREVRDLLREDRATRARLDDHERRIAAIEAGRG
jgi:hypothetical protein